jgi:glycosyltransferase involved in cell wall biosynthesis
MATKLNSEFDFDVVHHMTLSSYWSRAGLVAVNKPLVWGPLGGGTTSPNSLVAVMGLLGGIGDFARTVTRPLMAWLTGARRTGHLAAVVLTQNPETAERIKLTDRAVVLCHALAGALSLVEPEVAAASNDAAPRIVTAGRLVGWKATALAISAMRFLEHRDATLEVYGDGPERRRLERLSRRFGVSQRVRFHGNVPRYSLLEAIASADALVHPSLHEAGGFVIVEALTFGTPVVALNRGGPPILTSYWPDVPTRHIRASRPRNTAREIAEALDQVIGQRGIFDPTPSRYFVSGLLAAYRQAAEHDRS